VDDVRIQVGQCVPMAGGLVVGNTYDTNTSLPIAGVMVENEAGFSTHTAATEDEAVDDAFFVLFSPGSLQEFTASMVDYTTEIQSVDVVTGSVVRQDFYLDAGIVTADALGLEATVELGDSTTASFNLMNEGSGEATFKLVETRVALTLWVPKHPNPPLPNLKTWISM